VVNAGGNKGARDAVHAAALRRDNAILAGGLDESAYHAGFHSGPYELVQRLKQRGTELRCLDALPPATGERGGEGLNSLLGEVWPDKFTPERTAPLRENPKITALRQRLG
jgi:hypothetical protein